MTTTVLVTGGFDPLHSGHISYFKAARELGDRLIVGINSDAWLTRKKGRPFMPFEERAAIIRELACVDQVIAFNDNNNDSTNAIFQVLSTNPGRVIFANGGDRTADNIPEMIYDNVEFAFGVGGEDKKNSSSWILDEWKTQKTVRDWGYWRVLDDKGTVKVKELVINPGFSLSDQRHYNRSEHWYVLDGALKMDIEHFAPPIVVNFFSSLSLLFHCNTFQAAFSSQGTRESLSGLVCFSTSLTTVLFDPSCNISSHCRLYFIV